MSWATPLRIGAPRVFCRSREKAEEPERAFAIQIRIPAMEKTIEFTYEDRARLAAYTRKPPGGYMRLRY